MRSAKQHAKEEQSRLPGLETFRAIALLALAIAVILFLLRFVPWFPRISNFIPSVAFLIALLASLPLLFRMKWHLPWKLRDQLFLTYALIGLTPVVLLGLLASISAYILLGQFANFAAANVIQAKQSALATGTDALALQFQQELAAQASADTHPVSLQIPSQLPTEADRLVHLPGLGLGVYLDGKLQLLNLPAGHGILRVTQPPKWLKHDFSGLILAGDRIFFGAISHKTVGPHTLVVITGVRLDEQFLNQVVTGLGVMTVRPNIRVLPNPIGEHSEKLRSRIAFVPMSDSLAAANEAASDFMYLSPNSGNRESTAGMVTGGVLPKAENIFDIPIRFPSGLDATVWSTGKRTRVVAGVISRPSLLYRRLFQQSRLLEGWVRIAFISTAVAFAILELIAIFLANRLSRIITRSVTNLYHGTREVDQGHFNYRIPVLRRDQLGSLGRSFNAMSDSIVRLLAEQKEKERMQGELEIAHEVQSNLFPSEDIRMGGLELHGVCHPARTVSGDYYDFFDIDDHTLCMAIGDISGKGVSAALLMANLHAAVRAFIPVGAQRTAACVLQSNSDGSEDTYFGGDIQSPSNLMGTLNRHLYKSTQPEKYATLFLANYDTSTRALCYANGGQLPPLLLCADGSILRLDRGGSVVGLFGDCDYEQASVILQPGDLLVAYSDGATEPENESGDFGEDRLVEFILQHRHLPLSEICDGVMQAIHAWIGSSEQPDDITVVLARQH